MSLLSSRAWILYHSARMQVADMRGNHLGMIVGLVQPSVLLMITASGGRHAAGDAGAAQVFAVLLTSLWASTVWIAGGILRAEVQMGTLARSLTSVQPGYIVILGKSLGAAARSALVIIFSIVVTSLACGIPLPRHRPALAVVGVLTGVLSAAALGMILSCVLLLTRYGNQVSAAVMYPVFIVGGLLVPAEVLPRWLTPIRVLISMSWCQDFLTSLAGEPRWSSLALVVLLTCAYCAFSVHACGRVVVRARRVGSLELI